MADRETSSDSRRGIVIHRIAAAATFVVFVAALWLLQRSLANIHLRDVLHEIDAIAPTALLSAVALTAMSYVLLSGYDVLALQFVGRQLRYGNVAFASFVSYAFSHNVGMALLSGGSIRYRIYSSLGLSAPEIATITFLCAFTFALGMTVAGGLALLIEPTAAIATLGVPIAVTRAVGVGLLLATAGYVLWTGLRRRPIVIRNWSLTPPGIGLSLRQIVLACADLTVAAAVLYVLLPARIDVGFVPFLGVFVIAVLAGVLSHVPGGLGVFESALLLLLPTVPHDSLLAAALLYRLIYYVLPLLIAAILLSGFEAMRLRAFAARTGSLLVAWVPRVAPQVVGFTVLLAGVVLLMSGATPAVDARIHLLRRLIPLGLLELSHLSASLIGLLLLLLARGLFRRVDGAMHLTAMLLAAGIVFSLLKGFDYEEALFLAVVLIMLVASRNSFFRKSRLWTQPFTAGWIATICVAVAGTLWLGLLSYRNVTYAHELWWQFAFAADAPRFLRSSLLVVGSLTVIALLELLRPSAPRPQPPSAADLDRAAAIVAGTSSADAQLAFTGDKYLLFNDAGTAFVMYGVRGRTWIAMGDPIGPPDTLQDLAWQFRELGDRNGSRIVFYLVGQETLPIYLDLGMTLTKLGEEARVPLDGFSLAGSRRRNLRYEHHRAAKAGATFTVVRRDEVAGMMAELRAVSDRWLADKNVREKQFSVGHFTPDYIARFDIATVHVDDQLVAFANIWCAGDGSELSVDLMRYDTDAPPGIMDYLFVELMLWGSKNGYRWFNLGMAPLSGLETNPLAPSWHRIGTLIFRYGEHFYNFEGLYHYKEKFDPQWTPKYLASHGGLALPQALLNIAALISGDMIGLIRK